MDIESFIKALRDTDPAIRTIFQEGSCYRFAVMLQTLVPHGVLVINGAADHVALCVGGTMYDINGVADGQWMNMWSAYARQLDSRGELYPMEKETTVTVCDSCLTASCWHGEFYCDNHKEAGTTEKTISELKKLNLEHPDYWDRS